MTKSVQQIAIEFDEDDVSRPLGAATFNEIHQQLTFYEKTHYSQYLPTIGSDQTDFEDRLHDWLSNPGLTRDQKKLLFRLAPRIIFLNREDFTKLHQSAVSGPITRWVIDDLSLAFGSPNFDARVHAELTNHTWFTSITDSMRIADFHHANGLGGIDFRPDWRSLAKFGDPAKIQSFMSSGSTVPIKRIVILEDFVGSGAQMSASGGCVSFAAASFPSTPILLVPLVICPEGAQRASALASSFSNVRYEPMLQLRREDLVLGGSNAPPSERDWAQLATATYPLVEGNQKSQPRPYHPLGFPGHVGSPTGAVFVMYSNTPANTLPLIQHESNTWSPLFPRSARIR